MTTLIDTRRPERRALPTVDVLGVPWPVHKAYAVLAGALVFVVSLALFGSPQVTAWLTATAAVLVGIVVRYRPGLAATDPASNPPGIS